MSNFKKDSSDSAGAGGTKMAGEEASHRRRPSFPKTAYDDMSASFALDNATRGALPVRGRRGLTAFERPKPPFTGAPRGGALPAGSPLSIKAHDRRAPVSHRHRRSSDSKLSIGARHLSSPTAANLGSASGIYIRDDGSSGTSSPVVSQKRIALRSRGTWQPDSTAEKCAKCRRDFSGWFSSGKHHCRRCGRIFCKACCNLFVDLPEDWRAHTVVAQSWFFSNTWFRPFGKRTSSDRVCTDCHDNYTLVQKNPRVQTYAQVLRLCMISGYLDLPWLWCCVDVWMGKYWRAASDELKSQLRVLQYELPTHVYTKYERDLLWSNRHVLAGHSAWVVPLIKSVDDWGDQDAARDGIEILRMRPQYLQNYDAKFSYKTECRRPRKDGYTMDLSKWTMHQGGERDNRRYCYARSNCSVGMCTRHCRSRLSPGQAIQLLSGWQKKGDSSSYWSQSGEEKELLRNISRLQMYYKSLKSLNDGKGAHGKYTKISSLVERKLTAWGDRVKHMSRTSQVPGRMTNPLPAKVRGIIVQTFVKLGEEELLCYLPALIGCLQYTSFNASSPLADFLIARATNERFEKEVHFRTDVYWALVHGSCGQNLDSASAQRHGILCQTLLSKLTEQLAKTNETAIKELRRGYNLVTTLSTTPLDLKGPELSNYIRSQVENEGIFVKAKEYKSAWGSSLLASKIGSGMSYEHGVGENDDDDNSIAVPVCPSKKVNEVLYETAKRLSSAERPFVVKMKHQKNDVIAQVAFKNDCMRKDQVLLNCIRLMDIILKRELGSEAGDYNFETYRVLPTASNAGLVEFVQNAEVLQDIKDSKDWGSMKRYFEKCAEKSVLAGDRAQGASRSPNTAYNVDLLVQKFEENFMRSLAGYCVATYLLGVGDRHRHNIMVTHDGRIFNIDFGWCLGQDPKPFQPALRLTDFLIDGLGGKQSDRYVRFVQLANRAFNALRGHVTLFTTLLLPLTSDYGFTAKEGVINSKQLVEHIYWRYLPGTHDEEASAIFPRRLGGNYDGAYVEQTALVVSDAIHTEVTQRSIQKVVASATYTAASGVSAVVRGLGSKVAAPATAYVAGLVSGAFSGVQKEHPPYASDSEPSAIEEEFVFIDEQVNKDDPVDEI